MHHFCRFASFLVFYFATSCDTVVGTGWSACVSNTGVAVAFLVPQLFWFWIFSYVVAAWAVLVHVEGQGADPGFRVVAPYFIGSNVFLNVLLLGLFVAISQVKEEDKAQLGMVGSAAFAALLLLLAVAFAFLGNQLKARLTQNSTRPSP